MKELKLAVQNYVPNAPIPNGLVQGIAEGSYLIRTDWYNIARTVLRLGEFLQFKTWWADHAEIQAAFNRNNNILVSFDQPMGAGNWAGVENQLVMIDQALS